jgi:hypothetical protein
MIAAAPRRRRKGGCRRERAFFALWFIDSSQFVRQCGSTLVNSKFVRAFSSDRASVSQVWGAARFKTESPRPAAPYPLVIGLVLITWCSANAASPPTWQGGLFADQKPAGTVSYVTTSDNKLLLDGADNLSSINGETNYPGAMTAFPGTVFDVVMQQCFGGGFANGMQTWLNQYSFTAATNWDQLANNSVDPKNPASLRNFTASWIQGVPRGDGMYQHYVDTVNGATADGPKPAVSPDPYGRFGDLRKTAKGSFEDPTFASPDALLGDGTINVNGTNNGRVLNSNNQWAILMATQPNDRRFSTNIKRVYDALRSLSNPVPANHIVVLYGDSAANTTTPDGTPINGPMSRANFFKATSGGNAAGNLFGSITGLDTQGIPDQTAAKPDSTARLFVYNTGHGNSFTLNGARREDTVPVNPARIRVDAMPANGFVDANGNPPADGDTTSFVDLQISTHSPLNPGVAVMVNGTTIGSLMDDNAFPQTDLSAFIGTTYNYDVPVPLSFLDSFSAGSPVDVELDNVTSMSAGLVAAITFNDYGDAWSVSVVPEPGICAMLLSGLAIANVFRRRVRGRIAMKFSVDSPH